MASKSVSSIASKFLPQKCSHLVDTFHLKFAQWQCNLQDHPSVCMISCRSIFELSCMLVMQLMKSEAFGGSIWTYTS